MNDMGREIETKLSGTPQDTKRRAELLSALQQAYVTSGMEAVSTELASRGDSLVDEFDRQLSELKKLL